MLVDEIVMYSRADAVQVDIGRHIELVDRSDAGAVVVFTGIVRDQDEGRAVTSLEYSAHPNAAEVLRGLVEVAAASAEGVRGIAASHRLGSLAVGDVALCCAVSAEHRRQALEACGELVEEIKRRPPVWKHQFFADGGDEWVGSA